jgi:curved DNA-binding protein CbpA
LPEGHREQGDQDRTVIMEASMFIDYYEVLEISPNANLDTIERIFRHLAMRYHPDNPNTGDRARFSEVLEAHNTLKDPAKRAQYDIRHRSRSASRWELAGEASNTKGIERDIVIQDKLLSILYVKRRQDMKEPGIGEHELERLSACPREHLQFHLWYLKAKGWIAKMEDGMLAITVDGVDHANSKHRREHNTKLLTHPNRDDSQRDTAVAEAAQR